MLLRTLILGLLVALIVAPSPARAEVEYETTFAGVSDDIEDLLDEASELVLLEDKHPPTVAALHRRAEDDLERMRHVLEAEGYYDAALKLAIDETKHPVAVTVTVEEGPRYTLKSVTIVGADGKPPPPVAGLEPATLGLAVGAPARAAPVIAAEPRIAHAYAVHGRPYAKVVRHQAVIDVATKTMDLTYTVDPGSLARFGPLHLTGLTWLERSYVERRVKWREGEPYDQSLVDTTRQILVTSGLFGEVTVEPSGPVGPDGTVPMEITLVERLLHSVGAGAAYDTVDGLEGNVMWEDRDLFGNGEDLTATALGGRMNSGLDIKFRRPDAFDVTGLDFVPEISADNEVVEAFRGIHEEIQVGFAQQLEPGLTSGYALEAEHARINEKIDTRTYTLVGAPLYLREDDTDDLLNPTRGYRAGIQLTPYLRALGSELTYAQTQVTASTYEKLAEDYVLAFEGTLGASCCASLDSIPKDHRLYAGGGGSVRGFGFEKAGPWDQYDNPIGGRSLAEVTAEVRIQITPTIGLVPFLDAGTDYPSPFPRFDQKLYYGAGIGLRYFTAIGPIRLDLATPINPHPQGDSPIEVYVSIGQAF